MKMKSIAEVLQEVRVLIDTHFFDEFSGKVLRVFETSGRKPKCDRHETPQEDLELSELLTEDFGGNQGDPGKYPLRRKEKEVATQKRTETVCWCRSGAQLNAKHIIAFVGR